MTIHNWDLSLAALRHAGHIPARAAALTLPTVWRATLGRRPFRSEIALAIGAAWAAAAWFGFHFATVSANVSPIWPASAVALVAIHQYGVRYVPAVFLAATLMSLTTGMALVPAAMAGVGVAAAAAAGAAMLHRHGFRPAVHAPRDLVVALAAGAALPAVISATLGVAALDINAFVPAGAAFDAWRTWYLGDVLGVWLFAPALFALAARPATRLPPARLAEAAALVATTVAAIAIALQPGEGYPYLPFVPVLWAAYRFGLRTTGVASIVITLVTAWETAHGRSQFVAPTQAASFADTNRFLIVVGTVGTLLAVGVEQMRRSLEALRTSDHQFRAAFHRSASPKVISELDTGTIVEVNDAFLSLIGLDRAAVIGRTAPSLDFWVDTGRRAQFLAEARTGSVRNFDAELRARDGRVRQALISATTVPLHGKPHLFAVLTDVTEARALRAAAVQAQKEETLGRMAGGVAHDFNNLLTVIIGNVEAVRSELPGDHPAREPLDDIGSATDAGVALTRKLLAYGRRQPAELDVIDANQVLASAEPLIRRLAGQNIGVSLRAASEPATVRIGASDLQQVLLNLAANARDAMPDGGTLAVIASVVEADAAGPVVRAPAGAGALAPGTPGAQAAVASGRVMQIAVSDTGSGIPRDVRAQIFDPFFTTKPVTKGTGLGLSVVMGIVRQAGGTIDVESAVGAGTTFIIRLPIAVAG